MAATMLSLLPRADCEPNSGTAPSPAASHHVHPRHSNPAFHGHCAHQLQLHQLEQEAACFVPHHPGMMLFHIEPAGDMDDGVNIEHRMPDAEDWIDQWIDVTSVEPAAFDSGTGMDDGQDLFPPDDQPGFGEVNRAFYDKPAQAVSAAEADPDVQRAVSAAILNEFRLMQAREHLLLDHTAQRDIELPDASDTVTIRLNPLIYHPPTFVIDAGNGKVTVIDEKGREITAEPRDHAREAKLDEANKVTAEESEEATGETAEETPGWHTSPCVDPKKVHFAETDDTVDNGPDAVWMDTSAKDKNINTQPRKSCLKDTQKKSPVTPTKTTPCPPPAALDPHYFMSGALAGWKSPIVPQGPSEADNYKASNYRPPSVEDSTDSPSGSDSFFSGFKW